MLTPPKRRRGGQPGNSNALKHGYYTHRFNNQPLSPLESTTLTSLVEEVARIHLFTRRLAESSSPSADLHDLTNILRMLCLASATITRLIKAHAFLSTDNSSFQGALAEALRQVELPKCPADPENP